MERRQRCAIHAKNRENEKYGKIHLIDDRMIEEIVLYDGKIRSRDFISRLVMPIPRYHRADNKSEKNSFSIGLM